MAAFTHKTRTSVAVACTLVALVAMSACSSSSSASGGQSSSAPASGSMVLYTSLGYAQPLVDAFQQKTGLKVQVVNDSTGPLLTKISAEKNNPQWTMFWSQGDTAFASLDQQGMLQPYQANATLTSTGASLVPTDQAWQPTGVTVVGGVLCNADKVPNPPQQWSDLADPKYKGLIGINDPAQSGPAYPIIAGIMDQMGGEDQGKTYFTSLKANGFQLSADTVHALETGQVGCSIIPSGSALTEQTKQKGKMNLTLSFPAKSTLMVAGMMISKSASGASLSTAKQFEDFVLSAEGQQIANGINTADALYWPVVNGVSPRSELPAYPAQAQHIDPALWGPKQSEVVTWFTDNMK